MVHAARKVFAHGKKKKKKEEKLLLHLFDDLESKDESVQADLKPAEPLSGIVRKRS